MRLRVLFDAHCELCRGARDWLVAQPQLVPLDFVAAGSWAAKQQYPTLDHSRTLTEITVINENGEIYRGEKAWIMCLWALQDWREWAYKLASPGMRPAARQFVVWVSRHRHGLGKYASAFGW